MLGLRRTGSSGSVEIVVIDLEFNTEHTSAINVVITSLVRPFFSPSSIESRIFLLTPIIRSHTPPMWEECGGLNIHVEFEANRYFFSSGSWTFTTFILSSSDAPTKFVPRSDLNTLTGPLSEINRRSALMKAELLSSSTTSMCIARVLRQVNKIPQRWLLATPPLLFRVTTSHGPKVSTPKSWRKHRPWSNSIQREICHQLLLSFALKTPTPDALVQDQRYSALCSENPISTAPDGALCEQPPLMLDRFVKVSYNEGWNVMSSRKN